MECGTCGYTWNRPASEVGKKTCPKCQQPIAGGGAVGKDLSSMLGKDDSGGMNTKLGNAGHRQPGEVSLNKV